MSNWIPRWMRLGLIGLVIALAWSAVAAGEAIPEAWYRALSQIETGGRETAVGRHGERTQYQILPKTARAAGAVYRVGNDPMNRQAVAKIWRPALTRYVQATGRTPSASAGYAAWHRPGAFERAGWKLEKMPKVVRDRCARFANLVKDFSRNDESRGRPPATGAVKAPGSREVTLLSPRPCQDNDGNLGRATVAAVCKGKREG